MDRLHRTRLLIGDENMAKLRAATVMIVGCGAVGSFAIEALARAGVGHLILIDFDNIEESNINRQLFALDSTIGQPKVDVAAARIFDINPETCVDVLNIFFDDNTSPDFRPDFVIDAIDSTASKIALYKWCESNGIPFVSSMGAARKTDMGHITVGKLSRTSVCPLAAKMRRLARDAGVGDFDVVYSTEPADKNVACGRVFGSMITITGTFGLALANIAIKKLLKC